MTGEQTRALIAILMIAGFFGLVSFVMLGFANLDKPAIAELFGMLIGYIVAMLQPIIMRYFRDGADAGSDSANATRQRPPDP